ncbi:retropepsin-like aspartic protease [Joostella sp. CR20]|uniref:retropepsin-like aspartic protease n=1 Tax=Joostella sp. CR20 TaxID=2804312 RepID=UPI00313DD6BF
MKRITFFGLLFFAFAVHAQKIEQQTVSTYEKAFKNRSFEAMEAILAQNFTIGVYQRPSTDIMLKSILSKYFQLDSIQLKEVNAVASGKEIKLKYFFKDRKPFVSNLKLNGNNQIQYVDLFDKLYKIDRYQNSEIVASFPFEMENGSIVVKVKLNDSPEEFKMLFDTGADGMAISEVTAKKAQVKNLRDRKTDVVGGTMNVKFSSGNTIHVGGISIPNQNTVVFGTVRNGYDGLFGKNFLAKYITRINFDTKTITLYSFGKFEYPKEGCKLPFEYATQLPIVNLELELNSGKQVSGDFVFDTGADYNIIAFGPFVEANQLEEGFKVDFMSTNYSFGQQTAIKMGSANKLSIGTFDFKAVPTALQEFDADNQQWSSHDGSLGISIINRFNIIVNALDKVIYLEPNNNFNTSFKK